MKTIFVVDDNFTNLEISQRALESTYKVMTVPSAEKMFKLARKITPDLILLDVEMPEMDGYEALKMLKQDPKLSSIPVIFLTAKTDEGAEVYGFELGAVDYVAKPFSAPVLLKHLEMHLNLNAVIKTRTRQVIKLRDELIAAIADMVESRDEVTGGHIGRTQNFLEILINVFIESDSAYSDIIRGWDLELVIPSAQLHDIGKLNIPDAILHKPGKLDDNEFNIIKRHSIEGEKLIDKIAGRLGDDDFLLYAKRFAGSHHEKWNGKGYPRGLAGEDIPLEGRLMAVADVYDALVSARPYKKPFNHEQAVDIIVKDAGTHFDPKIVEVFEKVADEFWFVLEKIKMQENM